MSDESLHICTHVMSTAAHCARAFACELVLVTGTGPGGADYLAHSGYLEVAHKVRAASSRLALCMTGSVMQSAREFSRAVYPLALQFFAIGACPELSFHFCAQQFVKYVREIVAVAAA